MVQTFEIEFKRLGNAKQSIAYILKICMYVTIKVENTLGGRLWARVQKETNVYWQQQNVFTYIFIYICMRRRFNVKAINLVYKFVTEVL